MDFCTFWIRRANPVVYTDRGTSLADDRHFSDAIPNFEKALSLAPNDIIARTRLADALDRSGNHADAQSQISIALQQDPKSAAALIQSAISQTVDGRYDNAIHALSDAAQLAPDHPQVHAQLATCLVWTGAYVQAEKAAAEGLRINPFNADLHYQLALALASQHKTSEAIRQFQYVIAFQPDHIQGLNNLAWFRATAAEQQLRDGEEAVRLAQKSCQLSRNSEPMLLGTLAAAYAEAGNFADAVKTAEQARDLALEKGQNNVAEKNAELLYYYRAGKPYRDSEK